MELNNIMNLFSDMLIIIKDEFGNIIYPNDPQLIQYSKDLKPFGKQKDELFHPDTKRIYKTITCSYTENKKKYFLTRYVEITEYKKREKELQTDETTGLTIKKAAYKEFNEYLKTAIERGDEFSTIIADADFFKRVNDTYGHLAGDYILRYIADTLTSNIRQDEKRPKDLIGRIGGEEFMIVLKNIPATVTVSRVDSIRQKIANSHIVFDGQLINITCSFGVVHVPSKEIRLVEPTPSKIDSFRSQVQHGADLMLYKAKESGRNNVQISRFTI